MKKGYLLSLTIALTIALSILIPCISPALADDDTRGPGYGPGYGQGYGMMGGHGPGYGMGYGPDYGMVMCQDMGCMMGTGCGHGPAWTEYLDFLRKTRDLRKRIHILMFEYREAIADPETKEKDLDKVMEDLRKMQMQLQRAWMKMLIKKDE